MNFKGKLMMKWRNWVLRQQISTKIQQNVVTSLPSLSLTDTFEFLLVLYLQPDLHFSASETAAFWRKCLI